MTSTVLSRQHEGIMTITLNRPESLNALTGTEFLALSDVLEQIATGETGTRALVLTGGDRAFSSGADLQSSLQSAEAFDLPEANRIIRRLIDIQVPTIAAVSGPAAGIGCSLALACDCVVMAESSYLMLAFAKIGLMPDGGATALVAASAGRHRAMQMALTAQKVHGPQALDWGLASEVVTEGTPLERAQELAASFAQGAPLGLARTKSAINDAALTSLDEAFATEAEGQAALRRTNDFSEGVSAFVDKRRAVFTGS